MNDEDTEPKDGYDLEVYGIKNNTFYSIHIPAICCIITSLCCAVIVIILSFRNKSYRTFFSWTRSERFMVYLAVCDGLFNVAHSIDHLHMVITRDHVRPKQLCEFYGFTLAEFITAQNLMVNIVAVNAFMLIYFQRHLKFGRYDWRLLAWTFGAPFVGATIAGIAGQLGTNGSFCYFDGVKGVVANICFTTVPLLIILLMNIILYFLTWKRIRDETRRIRYTQGSKPASMRASHRAAKAMSLFVAAFFIQWWAMALFGIWALAGPVPQVIFHLVTTFSNLGGILNLGVFIIIRRRNLTRGETISSTGNKRHSPTPPRDSDHNRGSGEPPKDDIQMNDITAQMTCDCSDHINEEDNTNDKFNSNVTSDTIKRTIANGNKANAIEPKSGQSSV